LEVLFTDWDDIAKIITPDGNVSSLQGKPLASFDVGQLETDLESSPYVRNAEVYTQMDGVLSIEVEQRQPVFRVFRQNSSGYYVDKEGWKMPLSSKYTARVMVLRGAITEGYDGNDTIKSETLKQAFALMTALNEKEFWRQQIDEVQVDQKGEFTLIPKVGDQRILLGTADELDEKLHKLRLFYKHAMNRVGWSTYKVINLKYSGQVVCEK
jgi:cell division protein FtsQ